MYDFHCVIVSLCLSCTILCLKNVPSLTIVEFKYFICVCYMRFVHILNVVVSFRLLSVSYTAYMSVHSVLSRHILGGGFPPPNFEFSAQELEARSITM